VKANIKGEKDNLVGTSAFTGNNQSTTINNTTALSKTMRTTSNSTFRDTVQRGVLSGIGILKK
jgi:hypothetical protein